LEDIRRVFKHNILHCRFGVEGVLAGGGGEDGEGGVDIVEILEEDRVHGETRICKGDRVGGGGLRGGSAVYVPDLVCINKQPRKRKKKRGRKKIK
jgi:hypothetical protein